LPEIIRFAELASTNDEIAARAAAGSNDGLWVMAETQTSGRGRLGRPWLSPPGNLYCSTLVRAAPGEPPLQQLSFVAALALHEVLSAHVPGIRLKWPNDLLLAGDKLSGILLETANNRTSVVIGFGVNLLHFPTDAARPATSLAAHLSGVTPAAEDILLELAASFAGWRARWRESGFAVVRTQWLAQAAGLGQRIVAQLGHETLHGVFTDLDADGALLLQLDSGMVRAVHAGDIFGV
jgi:BirA family transcriptional regulator, biotin operon repressor / biotin---[acetyl-CoA-carboxylase] ligase